MNRIRYCNRLYLFCLTLGKHFYIMFSDERSVIDLHDVLDAKSTGV